MSGGDRLIAAVSRVPVVDQIPGLPSRLRPEELSAARDLIGAEVVTLARGKHPLEVLAAGRALALFVLSGFVIRNVIVAGRVSGVLAGPGALLDARRPDPDRSLAFDVRFRAVQPTRVAVLGAGATADAARFPTLLQALIALAFDRAHEESVTAAIRTLVHVELRLQALMWFYADRYGRRVGADTVLPIRLSHGDLAELVAGTRPAISANLAILAGRGEIVRRPDRTWLLRGGPPATLEDLRVREP